MKTLSKASNFLALPIQHSNYNNSEIVIYSAPLEKTVSYGSGTKNGPREILKASHYVEFYDEEMEREICFEKGIAAIVPTELNKYSSVNALKKINQTVTKLLNDNKFVFTLGGEHTISSAVINAHYNKYDNLSILQIDAHSDLRETYQGSKYSHACVMARVSEFTTDIHQVGIRAQEKVEATFIKSKNINTYYMRSIRSKKYGINWQNRVVKNLNENVYITFDIDGFDPSLIPATGTPEPGGLFWDETMELLKLVGNKRNIIGVDLVELAPSKNLISSNFTAAKLVYKILNYVYQ